MKLIVTGTLLAVASTVLLVAQALSPDELLHPPSNSWPTYNGDYSGRRFSQLKKINDSNIGSLSLAWVYRINSGGDFGGSIRATPLLVNGVLYFTLPDHAWAVDARTGHELWHYAWQSKGGIHLGNRGVGIYENWLYFETPDCHLVSLNLKDGKERWNKQICDMDRMYYASVAPIVVKNHVLVGVSGDDLDIPGYLESRDPETGDLQWHWNVTPKPGEPGSETWPSAEAMEHGGGMTWVPSTYDPELNLVFLGTGNPQPTSEFQKAAVATFGSYDIWKADFVGIGKMRGVGWAICNQNPANGRISNHWITLHETGNVAGFSPILVMDVWEHAFLLDYKPAERPKYIEAFFSNINWNMVEERLKKNKGVQSARA